MQMPSASYKVDGTTQLADSSQVAKAEKEREISGQYLPHKHKALCLILRPKQKTKTKTPPKPKKPNYYSAVVHIHL